MCILWGARLSAAWWEPLASPVLPWAVCVGAVAAAAAWTLWRVRRPGDLAVASAVDVRLGLHDRLSTGVAVAQRDDPFARAAMEDATRAASDARVGAKVSEAFPFGWSPRVATGPAMIAAAALGWAWLPAIVLGSTGSAAVSDPAEMDAARAAASARIEPVVRTIESNPSLAQALAESAGEDRSGARDGADGETAEQVRREAARRMTELAQRLDAVLQSEQAQQLDALKDALSRVEPSQGSAVQGLAEALKRGDAAAARKELESLAQRANDPSLDAQTREALAKSLEQLASQVESAASARDALAKALERSGMDPALASNPAALDKALAAAGQLNDAQKQSIRQAAAAQKSASDSLQKLSSAMQSCAGQCRNPGSGKEGSGQGSQPGQQGQQSGDGTGSPSSVASGSQMLSEMEQLAQMMQDAQAARSQCSGGSGQPTQLAASGSSAPTGQAGRGRGPQGGPSNGGSTPTQETAFGTKSRKERVAHQGGDVIARQLVDAPPVVGESRQRLREIAQEISRGVEEGTADEQVPPHLREAHRRYFGDMRKRIDQKAGSAAP